MSEARSGANQSETQQSIWVRFLIMLLFAFLFSIAETALYVVALIGFLFRLFNKPINANITSVGRSIGLYVRQIAEYLSFNTEVQPFPFSSWPSGSDAQTEAEGAASENTRQSPAASPNSDYSVNR